MTFELFQDKTKRDRLLKQIMTMDGQSSQICRRAATLAIFLECGGKRSATPLWD